MINLEKQKHIGIKQAKQSIANIYKKAKSENRKLTQAEHEQITRHQNALDRWQRASKRGWKL